MAECVEDKDMLDMANEELHQALEEEKKLQNLLLKSLLPKDDADERDCILEVRAGNNTFREPSEVKFHFVPIILVPILLNFFNILLNLTKILIRNWRGRGFFVCNGCIQNVSCWNIVRGLTVYEFCLQITSPF